MELVGELWAAHIRTEMLLEWSAHAAYEYAEYGSGNVRYLVVLSEALLKSSDTVKVKNLREKKGHEEEVPRSEVVQYLAAALGRGRPTSIERRAHRRASSAHAS
jgi:hypothetical protein